MKTSNIKSSLSSKIKLFLFKKELDNIIKRYKNERLIKEKIEKNKKWSHVDPYGEENWDD